MNIKEIEKLIALAKKEGLHKLKYEEKGQKIAITLPYDTQSVLKQPIIHAAENITTNTSGDNSSSNQKNKHQFHEVKSPFVGTFYTSPGPGEAPYVGVGQKVKKGQVLCIVEAMKIMNEIDSDLSGEIIEICVENESLVEYGQVLFLIKAN